jgi:hypothetical protein
MTEKMNEFRGSLGSMRLRSRQPLAIVPQTFAAGTLCCGIASAACEVSP